MDKYLNFHEQSIFYLVIGAMISK